MSFLSWPAMLLFGLDNFQTPFDHFFKRIHHPLVGSKNKNKLIQPSQMFDSDKKPVTGSQKIRKHIVAGFFGSKISLSHQVLAMVPCFDASQLFWCRLGDMQCSQLERNCHLGNVEELQVNYEKDCIFHGGCQQNCGDSIATRQICNWIVLVHLVLSSIRNQCQKKRDDISAFSFACQKFKRLFNCSQRSAQGFF